MDKPLAALIFAACIVMLARLLMGEPRRYRFDAAARRFGFAFKRRVLLAWHWRASKRAATEAADEVIRRARQKDGPPPGEWDGNVYKPKSFRKPPNKLH
jgi:hypothetical protein